MSPLRLPRLAALLLPTACAFMACLSERTTGSPRPSRGDGGGDTILVLMTSATSASSGPGGPSATASGGPSATVGSGSDAPLHCTGDAGAWDQLTAGPIACQSGQECCVIVSPCLSRSQIVAAANEKEASAAWPSCSDDCNDCIAQAIEVACVAGSCLGRVVEGAPLSSPLRQNHCGTGFEFLAAGSGPTALHFSCGPGP